MNHVHCQGCEEYASLSRRGFLGWSGATAAALAAPAWLPRVSMARSFNSAPRDVLISVFLRGGADALALVPPYADPNYYGNRPTTAIARPDNTGVAANLRAINLDGFFGLSPALGALVPAYQDGKLLIVHATGSTDGTRSHFDAQRFMESGKPSDPGIGTGWMGRHLASSEPMTPGAPLRGLALLPGLPRQMLGGPQALPIPDPSAFRLEGNASSSAQREALLESRFSAEQRIIRQSAADSLATIDLLNTISFTGYAPSGGAVYPAENFARALRAAAALIKAQIGVEAIAIDIEGWDTHARQGTATEGPLQLLARTLSDGLGAFYRDMTAGVAPSFVLTVMSEFGRRVRENGVQGTDHGHAGVMFVMGNAVAGGRVLTQWPTLQPGALFDAQDLQVTIDYRDVLAEIVSERLGNPNLSQVFPGFAPTFRGVTA